MNLSILDWAGVIGYLVITLVLGLYFRRRSSGSTEDYFVSGRKVSWWLAGTSMVATTFAADTPLVVAGLVYTQGIAGNWLWWSLLPSGMMTVFFFARLWRRSGLITDAEFSEMRYSGRAAAFLRGFRALYFGLLMSCLILGWVTKAMSTIIVATLGVSETTALLICLVFLMPFTGLYVSLGGLWGVLWTDLFQFVLKMAIVITIAWYAVAEVGGMSALLERLGSMRAVVPGAGDPTAFFPDFSRGLTAEALWLLPALTFIMNLAVQWWAVWYPGAEPGGGSYIAQRIFSARDERNGVLSVLWFNMAHYAVRPWPWIIAALAAIVLYPGLEHPETGYMRLVTEHMPHAWRGVIIAGFMAAFMSTVATYINWGASYLVNDFYRRFVRREGSERHYVNASRIATLVLVLASVWVSAQLMSIAGAWQLVMEIGAGTGAVYLLRWYWWRVNAWSEISGLTAALAVALALRWEWLWRTISGGVSAAPFTGSDPVLFAKTAIVTTAVTTLVWLLVTLFTRPESDEVLVSFYRKVRPDVRGWTPIARLAADTPPARDLGRSAADWLLGCAMVYLILFGTGKLLLRSPGTGAALLLAGCAVAVIIYLRMARRDWSEAPPDSLADTPRAEERSAR
ncbi:MAG: sodium:solute symporter family protein [Acidobacteriota bacterium]